MHSMCREYEGGIGIGHGEGLKEMIWSVAGAWEHFEREALVQGGHGSAHSRLNETETLLT